MQPAFYDPTIPYEENFKNGPPLLKNHLIPKKRIITKKQKFLGFPVNMPFGIGAGPIPNATFVKAAFDFGFDVVNYKTQRSVSFPSNAFPTVLFVQPEGDLTLEKAKIPLIGTFDIPQSNTFSVMNSFGNPSFGPSFWQDDFKKAITLAGDGQILIFSTVGTIPPDGNEQAYYQDFANTAKLAVDVGAKVVEINLSCPNVSNEGVLCYTKDAVEAICKKTRKTIGNIPVIIKIGYFSSDQQTLLEEVISVAAPYIDAISATNSIPAPIIDEKGNPGLPGPNRLKAGISGHAIKWAGIDMTKRLAQLREKRKMSYEIIGLGGVMNATDYADYRNAGADCVQSVAGALWNPYLAYEIWKANK